MFIQQVWRVFVAVQMLRICWLHTDWRLNSKRGSVRLPAPFLTDRRVSWCDMQLWNPSLEKQNVMGGNCQAGCWGEGGGEGGESISRYYGAPLDCTVCNTVCRSFINLHTSVELAWQRKRLLFRIYMALLHANVHLETWNETYTVWFWGSVILG